MRFTIFAAVAALTLSATAANAGGFGGLKALRDVANAAAQQALPSAQPQEQAASVASYAPITSDVVSNYRSYRNRVTVYQHDCSGTQSGAKETVCLQASRIDDRITVMRCQEVFGYEGSYATDAQREQAENTMQRCAAEYDKDAKIANDYRETLAGRSNKAPTHGAGTVASF